MSVSVSICGSRSISYPTFLFRYPFFSLGKLYFRCGFFYFSDHSICLYTHFLLSSFSGSPQVLGCFITPLHTHTHTNTYTFFFRYTSQCLSSLIISFNSIKFMSTSCLSHPEISKTNNIRRISAQIFKS